MGGKERIPCRFQLGRAGLGPPEAENFGNSRIGDRRDFGTTEGRIYRGQKAEFHLKDPEN